MPDNVVRKYSEYDHHDPDMTLDNVHETWDTLRGQCPIGRSDAYGGMWVVTGFPEANEILHKPEIFSSSPLIIPPFPQAMKMVPVEIDPPDHLRYRTLVATPFSPRRAERYEEPLRVIVNQLIDEFIELGRCDIYHTLAIPFPTLMGTTMLGLPNEDATKFEEWTHKIIHMSATDMEVAGEAAIAQEEIFGPVLAVIPYEHEEEAIEIANDSIYGLSGAVWSSSTERVLRVAKRIKTGTLDINGASWWGVDTPFGGMKQSGIGRENGETGFNEYLDLRVISHPTG